MTAVLPVLGIITFFLFGILQIGAGYAGIEHHLGHIWALIIVPPSLFFRFTLPITIGAFFCALDVWELHWILATLFAAPGLVLIIPGVLAGIIAYCREIL